MQRQTGRAAVVDVDRLRDVLAAAPRWRARIVAEAGGFSVFIPGVPVAADGETFDEAVDDMIDALREYAQDWQERLGGVPPAAPGNALPAELVALLVHRVGVPETEVAAMSREQAVRRLERYRTDGG